MLITVLPFRRSSLCLAAVLSLTVGFLVSPAWAQPTATEGAPSAEPPVVDHAQDPLPELPLSPAGQETVDDIARQVDQDERAQEVTAGILQPIYTLAEKLAFPAFHWVAFAIMATGVVSFALQTVLGKLAVLMRGSISFKEILSDILGLVISLLGLVLTTQAAAENSTFTSSPAAVLSAAGVGVVAGFIFYLWGQSQELQAAKGRKVE